MDGIQFGKCRELGRDVIQDYSAFLRDLQEAKDRRSEYYTAVNNILNQYPFLKEKIDELLERD
jgi:uncharacterized coiled-coil DUF342 family protein